MSDENPPLPATVDDVARLGPEGLGAALAASHSGSLFALRYEVVKAVKARGARFTPAACLRIFDALLDGPIRRRAETLLHGTGALLRTTGPWPDGLTERAGRLARASLARNGGADGFPLLALAVLAGPDLYREALAAVSGPSGQLDARELRAVQDWDATGLALLAEVEWNCPFAPLPDTWRRIADLGYSGFARGFLDVADERVAAIQKGEIPYQSDKAFTEPEVEMVGRAARVALLRDEPWLPDLLHRVVPGVAVAPTGARTLPSQAMIYELARAAQDFPTPELVAALRTARARTLHRGVSKKLERSIKAIDAALADRDEVALRMPDLGFDSGGVLRTELGEHTAVITVGDGVELTFLAPGGKPLRSVPAAVRRDHKDALKELRDLVKRVRVQLTTLVRALEGGLAGEVAMPCATWRERLAEHPIAAPTVRRLIWEAETAPGRWEAFLPESPVEMDGAAPVRLWHPIRATPDEVAAWRDAAPRQPFKQAYREVYRLTPAEEETRVYSNRYAGHMVGYRQLFALMRGRGWQCEIMGHWSRGEEDEATRVLGGGRWRASLFHAYSDPVDEHELATTDQVRFSRLTEGPAGGWGEVPLAEVPAAVFSEAMRDVDLFVGVTSIASDPQWEDRGEERHRVYWRSSAFGELTETAEVRRDALARLLPMTPIADRCTLDGRFLEVRGGITTYRIHLGSGNILMAPDDAYLCIVPKPSREAGKVLLPFEEDRLSLILSKAFLLAADTEITDPSIRSQIDRRS